MGKEKCLCSSCERKICRKVNGNNGNIEVNYLSVLDLNKKIKIIEEILILSGYELTKNLHFEIKNGKIYIQSIEENIYCENEEICLKNERVKIKKEELLGILSAINLIEEGYLDEVGYYTILDKIGIDLFFGKLVPLNSRKTIRVITYAQIKRKEEDLNNHKRRYPGISTIIIKPDSLIQEIENKILLFFKNAFEATELSNYIKEQFVF